MMTPQDPAGPDQARHLLRRTLGAVRRDVVLCVLAGLAWQAVAVAVPWVLERAVDQGIIHGDRRALWWWSAALVALGLLRWFGDAARHWWVERAGAHAADHLRRRMVDRLLAMSDDDIAGFGHGDVAARALGDTDKVWNWVSGIATLATASFTLVAVVALLITLDPSLALVGLATMPLAALFATRQVGTHRRAWDAVAEGAGGYAGGVESAIAGVRTVKGLGAESVTLGRVLAASDVLRGHRLRLARIEASWLAVAAAIPAAGVAAGLWIGGQRVLEGNLSVGSLVAFAGWMGLLVDATVTLTERLTDRGAAIASATRLAQLLGDQVETAPSTSQAGRLAVEPQGLDIAVGGVAARRGEVLVLRDLDLDVPAGEWLAVVGVTGSGKTTLLRLLAGLDAPLLGRVLHGGVDLRHLTPRQRAARVALVPQAAALVSGTTAEVLRLGAPAASDGQLWDALEIVGATETVAAMGGLDGPVGDRGLSLSGGQRQRLALAAAVVCRPSVLLLDDTTSALDPHTEGRVLGSLRRGLPEATVVVATHRLATASACDRALVLVDGGLIDPTRSEVEVLLGAVDDRGGQ